MYSALYVMNQLLNFIINGDNEAGNTLSTPKGYSLFLLDIFQWGKVPILTHNFLLAKMSSRYMKSFL